LAIGVIVFFVQISARPFEKMNITLPRRLLAQIDEYAQTHGERRSGFLAEAARASMRR
jgi:metal-responsive CopG/Arc/MetJ family transcriptional regulator